MSAVCGNAGGMTKAGAPCRMSVNLGESGLCLMHDPARAAEGEAIRALGRAANAIAHRQAKAADPKIVPRAPRTLEDAVKWSSWTMHAIANGSLDPRVGHECGYLIARFTEALNKRDLLRKIEDLERKLADAQRQSPRAAIGIARG